MRILITGATGLIGSELVSLLLQNGVSIHYLTTSKHKIENQPNYKGFFWNPEQGIIDENCLMGVDAIIHLAGATIAKRWTKSYKQEIIESRIFSSNVLYKALKENPNQVKQIVSASGTAIYPNSYSKIYTEDSTEIDDGFLGNVVMKWEESVDKFKSLGIKVCKLRTGIVLAKKGGALLEMLKPIKLGLGSPFGDGKQMQSWIHLHDLAEMYFFAVKYSWEGVYNAVAPQPITNEALTKTIATILEKPLFMPNIPKFVMKLILGEMHELLFTNKNLSAQKAINEGFKFKFPTAEKALTNILA
ncbi:TIGR01777 family oxidoreductase [Flavobacterium luteum]|uniref:TIGR01777 family protein n=1 Tax=Flavobacterium luteum TaxID=2026654 RepID=A0A7J5ABX5_9FLAO|nr:TIGR01777 family oxidoreductase [Flavobacterium luteum]KAB1155035.1 TIGR01777 family protein [Flavobacterium luteum]